MSKAAFFAIGRLGTFDQLFIVTAKSERAIIATIVVPELELPGFASSVM
ncbi:hypothetical protein [Planktotalea sp.]|nr:hypothetical protein [Planktotalea sp.]